MTISTLPLPLHEVPGYRAFLESALSAELTTIRRHAAGHAELVDGDFEAALAAVRSIASELRWLTLGEQPVPF